MSIVSVIAGTQPIGSGEPVQTLVLKKTPEIVPAPDPAEDLFQNRQRIARSPAPKPKTVLELALRHNAESVTVGLLNLLPSRFLDHLESKSLFPGHYCKDFKASLAEMKTVYPDLKQTLNTIEAVHFNSAAKVRHLGWFIPPQSGKPTILQSLGNFSPLSTVLRYKPLFDEGYGFMAYEYPGYGSTKGTPTEAGINAAGEAASHFLEEEKHIPRKDQVFHGISLGGTVATHLARQLPCKGVILESTMTSFPEVAKLKVETRAPSWLVPLHKITRSQMASVKKIKDYNGPLLLLHGAKDSLMPARFAEKLYQQAGTPQHLKKLVIFPRQGHNMDTGYTVPYIQKFLKAISQRVDTPPDSPFQTTLDALRTITDRAVCAPLG